MRLNGVFSIQWRITSGRSSYAQELVYDKVVHLALELTFNGADVIFEWIATHIGLKRKC